MCMKKCDELRAKFGEAYDEGKIGLADDLYLLLKDAYEEHFGEYYEDVLHVAFHHMGADLYDFMVDDNIK